MLVRKARCRRHGRGAGAAVGAVLEAVRDVGGGGAVVEGAGPHGGVGLGRDQAGAVELPPFRWKRIQRAMSVAVEAMPPAGQ
jgi:hypothetical protein